MFPSLDKDRLRFVPFIAHPYEHQHRIARLCDVVLDNRVYNAHTMAVDTLWAGPESPRLSTPTDISPNTLDLGFTALTKNVTGILNHG